MANVFLLAMVFGRIEKALVRVDQNTWKTQLPNPKIAGFHPTEPGALNYIRLLDGYNTLSKKIVPIDGMANCKWYAGGGTAETPSGAFFEHFDDRRVLYRSFVAAKSWESLKNSYNGILKTFVEGFKKGFPEDPAQQIKVAPVSDSPLKIPCVEENFPIYQEAQHKTRLPAYTGQPLEERSYKQIAPNQLQAYLEKNPFVIGLNSRPKHVVCQLVPDAVGGETAAVYEVSADGQNFIVKQSLDNTLQGLGHTQFENFKRIEQKYGTIASQFPIKTEQFSIELALPIRLCKLKDVGDQYAYLEILRKAKGDPAAQWLEKRSTKLSIADKWRVLGQVLGLIHKKIGKFDSGSVLVEVPEIDYQLKNIFVFDDGLGQITVTLIDLGSMGKNPITTQENIYREINTIVDPDKPETLRPSASEEESYLEGYRTQVALSQSAQESVLRKKEAHKQDREDMCSLLKELNLEVEAKDVLIDGDFSMCIPPSRWAQILKIYAEPKIEDKTLNLLRSTILKLRLIPLKESLAIEDEERKKFDAITQWMPSQPEDLICHNLIEISKKLDDHIAAARKK